MLKPGMMPVTISALIASLIADGATTLVPSSHQETTTLFPKANSIYINNENSNLQAQNKSQWLKIRLQKKENSKKSFMTSLHTDHRFMQKHVVTTISKRRLPFETFIEKTTRLPVGQYHVLHSGEEGIAEIKQVRVFLDGRMLQQAEHVQTIRPPTPRVLLEGIAPVLPPIQSQTYNQSNPESTLSARSSNNLQSAETLTVVATAYVAGGITATGRPAEPGVIAVDPSVIPLGSVVYIPGFGDLIAADTGGAIQGDRIDICMATEQEALDFGRRTLTLYVLKPGSAS
ncbi:G5 and 3D domain-containing protein [Alicyclobacillus tolerans]|uniref:3D (Asp-Asp-Asp) domain-containing protein n=1 Tax=Alicyclobacillus tolerans TaxID=90970 RepID=A0A1M6S6M1_9BACL|nr:3D domain-containing protein [Alicyclobacillus montanus]SHK40422.1 3D (Asp-Asp-Asp) domain-containing protein [Alicyclobacillus montanus]